MPKRIILLRHGETDYNVKDIIQGHTDVPLNKKGLEQAKKVADLLKNEKIHAVYSSDLKRAYQTAKAVAKYFKLSIIKSTELRERNLGKLQGVNRKKLDMIIKPTMDQFWNFVFGKKYAHFGAERQKDIEKRVRSLLKKIKKHKNQNVLLVTHGGTIRRIFKVLGHDLEFVKNLIIDNTALFHLIKKKGKYNLKV